jgi:hypothetical protein
MPIVIDVEKEVTLDNPRDRDLNSGVELELTNEQKKEVVMTRFVTTIEEKADWNPGAEWFEQVVVDVRSGRQQERLLVKTDDGDTRGLQVDDGLIVDLMGTVTGIFGILPNQPPMDQAAMDAYMDQNTDASIPTYRRYDFRVSRVLKTNGPEGRMSILKSEDQKRQNAQTEMYDAFKQMFVDGFSAMQAQGNLSPTPQEVLSAGTKKAAG